MSYASSIVMPSQLISRPPFTPRARGIITPRAPYPIIQRSALNEAPPNSWPFVPNGATVIPAIGESAVICSQTVPSTKSGIILAFANGTNQNNGIQGWIPGSGDLVWQILRNGIPVQYFNNIVICMGLTENGGMKLAAPIHLRANDNIAMVVNNIRLAVNGQVMVGSLNGYVFPARQDPGTSR